MMTAPALDKPSLKRMRAHVADVLRKATVEGTFKLGNLLQDTVLAEQLSDWFAKDSSQAEESNRINGRRHQVS